MKSLQQIKGKVLVKVREDSEKVSIPTVHQLCELIQVKKETIPRLMKEDGLIIACSGVSAECRITASVVFH